MHSRSAAARSIRSAALLALGALAVHQARYLVAPGGGHGHEYLESLAPLLAGATGAAIAISILVTLARRCLPAAPRLEQTTERAAAFAAALLVVYLVQEVAEGLLVPGHSPLAAFAGPGGWLAMPLAITFGALAALAVHWLDRAEHRVAAALRPARPAVRRRATTAVTALRVPRSVALAFELSPRPPPLAAVG